MRFVHSVTIRFPCPPGDQSPGYSATPHQWGLKAGLSQRRCVARTLHVRAECANLLPSGLVGFVLWDRRSALAPTVRQMEMLREREEKLEAVLREYALKSPELAESLKKILLK